MSRGLWMLTNALLLVATVLAGWFAANAPEAARPSLSAFDRVELSAEAPPLPPAPYRAAAADSAKALERRALFSASRGGGGSVAPAPPRGSEPMARTVLARPASPAKRYETPEESAVSDDFRAALALTKPRHEQYFGGHLIAPESRDSDLDDYTPADGVAPDYAGRPKINPKRPEASTPIADVEAPEEEGVAAAVAPPTVEEDGEAPGAVDEAALDPTAGDGQAGEGQAAAAVGGEPEDMILLGVFQSRGAERALVRTATGGNVRVRPGDEIEGWRVSAIGEDNILLRRASKIRVLRLPE